MENENRYIDLAKHCIGLDRKKPYIRHGKKFYRPYRKFYSDQQNRMITGYRITEKQPYKKKNGEMSVKEVKLFNGCSQVEVLR